jgi:hypothetical protein
MSHGRGGGDVTGAELRSGMPSEAGRGWLPEPLVAAAGCYHLALATVELAEGATLAWRDELVCGRHTEPPGNATVSLSVRYAGRPLLCQSLSVGPRRGWLVRTGDPGRGKGGGIPAAGRPGPGTWAIRGTRPDRGTHTACRTRLPGHCRRGGRRDAAPVPRPRRVRPGTGGHSAIQVRGAAELPGVRII